MLLRHNPHNMKHNIRLFQCQETLEVLLSNLNIEKMSSSSSSSPSTVISICGNKRSFRQSSNFIENSNQWHQQTELRNIYLCLCVFSLLVTVRSQWNISAYDVWLYAVLQRWSNCCEKIYIYNCCENNYARNSYLRICQATRINTYQWGSQQRSQDGIATFDKHQI